MSYDVTRRDFLKTSALATGAMTGVGAWVGATSVHAAAADVSALSSRLDTDLLRAVGERIGADAALRVAPNGAAVSLVYFDYAGPTIDPLRAGIERGLAHFCGDQVAVNEVSLPYGELLGVAIVRNLETAVETRVEIDATMLSHLALIEANAPSLGIAKSSIASADAAYFYRTPEFA
jgi:hypothetical protein